MSATSDRQSSKDNQAFVELIAFFSFLFLFRPTISPNREYLTPVHSLFNRHLLLDFVNASASWSYALSQAFSLITPDISENVTSKSSFAIASGPGGGGGTGHDQSSGSNLIKRFLVNHTFHFFTFLIPCIPNSISNGKLSAISTVLNLDFIMDHGTISNMNFAFHIRSLLFNAIFHRSIC
jgi:hypothetical protein